MAATSAEIAKEALRLIDVSYEILPAVFDVEEALKPDAPQLHDDLPGNIATPGSGLLGPKGLTQVVMGDVDKALQKPTLLPREPSDTRKHRTLFRLNLRA